MLTAIITIIIFYVLYRIAKNKEYEDAKKLAQQEKEAFRKRGLEYIGGYAGKLLSGFDNIGSCKFCIELFDKKIELLLTDNMNFRQELDIFREDIKGARIITERHLIERENLKENKKNAIKYGLVGAKLLEQEKETDLIGVNLVELDIVYNREEITLLFKFIGVGDEREFVQHVNNLVNKNVKSGLVNN